MPLFSIAARSSLTVAQSPDRVLVVLALVIVECVALAFGDVHRHVGVAQQLLGVARMVGEYRDADADTHFDRNPARVDRRLQAVQQILRKRVDERALADVREDHGELVAADAADERTPASFAAKRFETSRSTSSPTS